MEIKVKKMDSRAHLPLVTDGNACFDFYALEDTSVTPIGTGKGTLVRTGLALEIPEGYHMKLFMRSSYGAKTNLILGNCVGIVDSSYRGEIMGIFKTFDTSLGMTYGPWIIREGDRFLQGLIEKNIEVVFTEVDELSETDRGDGGFGSTGK